MKAKKWIGVDIHKKQFTVCILTEDAEPILRSYERESEGMREFLKEIDKETVIGVESTTWTWDFARKLQEHAKDVVIFNTIDLKALMDKMRKTDKIDAERIALIIRRFEKNELTFSHIKDELGAEIKGLLKVRESMVLQKTKMKNEIIAMLDFWGVGKPDMKLFGKFDRDLQWIEQQNIPESIRKAICGMYATIINFENNIAELNESIKELSIKMDGYEELIENISGIGSISAAYLISKIEDIERFDDPKKLVSYLGLAPRVHESDGKGYNGKITKRTDKGLIRVLVQAAWASVRYNPAMKEFYDRLKTRRGKQKAIIAVARKLIVISYYVLKNYVATQRDLANKE